MTSAPQNPGPEAPATPAPVTLAAVLGRIRAYARVQGWTGGRLATAAGLSRGTLGRLYEPDFLPSSSTIFAIERVIPPDWQPGDAIPADPAAPAAIEAEQATSTAGAGDAS